MSALWAILTAFALVLAWAWFYMQVLKGNEVHDKTTISYIGFIVQAKMHALVKPMREFAAAMARLQLAFAKTSIDSRKMARLLREEREKLEMKHGA